MKSEGRKTQAHRQVGRRKLARELREARQNRALTIAKLAAEAGVSSETIVAIERAVRVQSRAIRFDVIFKLARALEQSHDVLMHWLRLAGHEDIRQEQIDAVLSKLGRTRPGLFSPPPSDPLAFFRELRQKIRPNQTLLAVSFTSLPGTREPGEIRDTFVACIREGLWVAMTCPYPRGTPRADLPNLNNFYSDVRNSVVSLTKGFRNVIGAKRSRQIAVFVPATEDLLIAPPFRMVEYRPALTHFRDSREHDELGVWLKMGAGAPDRWLRVNPPGLDPMSKAGKDAQMALETWREYFDDVIQSWSPESELGWIADPEGPMRMWRREY